MGKVASFREKFTHRFTPGASAAHAAARINGGDIISTLAISKKSLRIEIMAWKTISCN